MRLTNNEWGIRESIVSSSADEGGVPEVSGEK
jgi:hypothetical protein